MTEADTRTLGDFARVDAADARNLVSRLDVMHGLEPFKAYKADTFRMLRVGPGSSVADVGCGTGEDARSLAEIVGEQGRVVGIDLSEAMLTEARERHAAAKSLTFKVGPADALPLPDNGLDAIRADRVLIHVPGARAALHEMIRVTRPGGRIVVSEPDMPGCWVASDNYALTGRIMGAIAGSCIAPFLARDLYPLFRDAGLEDITFSVVGLSACEPESVNAILDFGRVIAGMMAAGRLDAAEAAAWTEDLEQRGRAGRFAAGVSVMVASGTKPK